MNATHKDMQPGPAKECLANFCVKIKRAQDLETMVQYSMARPQYKTDYTKISWNMTEANKEVSELMIACMVSGGAERYWGAAPRNPHERKIPKFLSRKTGGEDDEDDEDKD